MYTKYYSFFYNHTDTDDSSRDREGVQSAKIWLELFFFLMYGQYINCITKAQCSQFASKAHVSASCTAFSLL